MSLGGPMRPLKQKDKLHIAAWSFDTLNSDLEPENVSLRDPRMLIAWNLAVIFV